MLKFIKKNKSVLGLALFIAAFKSFAYNPTPIPSGSMEPTIKAKTYVMVNTHAYGIRLPFTKTTLINTGEPQRGDIVVFRAPFNESTNFFKRIVAVPGDTIYFNKTEYHVNALPSHPENFQKVTVPADKYFAMGDNIKNSYDSRYWGFVPKENLVGKYEFKIASYNFLAS